MGEYIPTHQRHISTLVTLIQTVGSAVTHLGWRSPVCHLGESHLVQSDTPATLTLPLSCLAACPRSFPVWQGGARVRLLQQISMGFRRLQENLKDFKRFFKRQEHLWRNHRFQEFYNISSLRWPRIGTLVELFCIYPNSHTTICSKFRKFDEEISMESMIPKSFVTLQVPGIMMNIMKLAFNNIND